VFDLSPRMNMECVLKQHSSGMVVMETGDVSFDVRTECLDTWAGIEPVLGTALYHGTVCEAV
jgi:hypothetical protein